ncbi:hypothetical protein [Winogradskya humida]|uniref:RHS repeat-associated protein n=1 Tax=Winogradskya humida TaxID=113566 RepID=A0ABQ3ZKD1_9ACTN|nr:hypothetical protein [Actinoplanes humidus]GIE18959.1 hypothetical protein Ahu01nite_020610 [Actinoplanes humidus]
MTGKASLRRPFEPVPDNAQVFSASGRALRSFRVGDGVAHLAVDEPGTIWAGYFDEGVYSGDPFSAGGLTLFDEYGRQLWAYWPPSGFDDIADCYALNVGPRTTWAYYYMGFPLIRVTDHQARSGRPHPGEEDERRQHPRKPPLPANHRLGLHRRPG